MTLSTHVLDAVSGSPAVGMAVKLEHDGATVAEDVTDADGRVRELGALPAAGDYRITFATGGWFAATGTPGFYPEGTKNEDFLRFYAERFDTVELNTTGYRLPSEEQFKRWADAVPDGFRFAVKMPVFRLDRIGTSVERFSLDTKELFRVTRLVTGVAGITRLSPALTVSPRTGQILVSIFTDDRYEIHALDPAASEGDLVIAARDEAALETFVLSPAIPSPTLVLEAPMTSALRAAAKSAARTLSLYVPL